MRYLIDTQIFIWALIAPEKLTAQISQILKNNDIFVSQVSLFEIAIKQKRANGFIVCPFFED